MIAATALLIAMAIDRCFGEPAGRWHPVVWIGRYLGAAGRCLAPRIDGPSRTRYLTFAAGAAAWCAGAAVVALAALAVEALALRLPWLAAAMLLGVALKPMLSWRMLRGEVLAVEASLAESLDAG
ncbi:MAG: cobalamin biosynthesis protein, partial [Variovorax sp.]